ncbi:thiamine phosphate synthase [Rickettsiella grylli]|uniref:Thiamine-phosphate synthase n=1 Tax=Rickettsiella grylli TaxID=59196 RepID=A8PMT5_9COXI|nr:thiamine phosphate synthase [Rickettsiella grylli]EDP46230.1 thiamine-phosphate pyrophosphorylase [Rickettsiella grylli]
MNIDYSYYLLADEQASEPLSVIDAVQRVLNHTVRCVQLRMKNQRRKKIMDTGKQLVDLLQAWNIPLIINDHADIACAIDAAGVHLGQTDRPYPEIRQHCGYKKIIGLTIENSQQAQQCRHYDCDYFGVGPIFSTVTKKFSTPPLGLVQFNRIMRILNAPVVAIGGITLENVQSVLETGCAGIAVASAVFQTPDPVKQSQKFAHIISQS